MEARVKVILKRAVLDPQGKAVLNAMHSLGVTQAEDVRVGKYFEIKFSGGDKKELQQKLDKLCDQVLANPVIEDYSYEIL